MTFDSCCRIFATFQTSYISLLIVLGVENVTRSLIMIFDKLKLTFGGPAHTLRFFKTQRHAYLSSGIVHLGD